MALVFVLTCFVSVLSIMVVSGQNLTTTTEPLDVTTEILNNNTNTTTTEVSFSESSYKTNCSEMYKGYCQNEGICVYLIDVPAVSCLCAPNYGGQRCEKWMWYHAKGDCEVDKTIDNLKLVLLLLVIIVLVLVIVFMAVLLKRHSLKMKKLEKRVEKHSQSYDYGARYLPSTMYSAQISIISHEKNDPKSRSAPMAIGRLSQSFFNHSQTEPNGLSELLKASQIKQDNEKNNLLLPSNGVDSSA